MSFNMAGLTFSEAYTLRKKSDARYANKKNRNVEASTTVTNISDLESVMRRLVAELEGDSKNVVRYVKGALKEIPPHFAKHVTIWHDSHSLDILQHVIINNKPELVTFILAETNYFPVGYVPTHNPYAHLAAILGHTDCLKQILSNRPSTFFKSDRQSHAIKLPDEVMKKTKLNETAKSVPRSAEKILAKIKYSTKHEEKKLQKVNAESSDSDIASVLDKELGAIEKTFVKNKMRLPKDSLFKEKKVERRRSVSKKAEDDRSIPEMQAKPLKLPPVPTVRKSFRASMCARVDTSTSTDSFRNHFTRRLIPEKGKHEKHLITVFWDALSDLEPGVVKGAGVPVPLKISPHAHYPRRIDLDRDNFHSTGSATTDEASKSLSQHRRASLVLKTHVSLSSTSKLSLIAKKALKTFEPGIRSKKKYKEFHLQSLPHPPVEKDESDSYMNKTPLTYAAERGHIDCVQLLLDMVVMKRHPSIQSREPLTLATKARSPESIILLMDKKPSRPDLQSAVMLSIREMYPDCLTALLTNQNKDRNLLFDGTNLYHILYSQSVISSKRYELMPEMTRALISCKEDVNSRTTPRTYPMYTLINCAFNITVGKQIFFFIDCLNILLECKANPHYDEEKLGRQPTRTDMFTRQPYTSAISCVFECAKSSIKFFESSYWSNMFTKKFITTIELHDRTSRRVLNNVLFDYMDASCLLGLDKTIVRCLLRYGGNPDHKKGGKYAVNVYFDHLLPYLTRFEIIGSYQRYINELSTLMVICRSMSFSSLSEALVIFLTDHLLSAPIQALPISRQFASMMDALLRTPRPLAELAGHVLWVRLKRNKKKVRELPISEEFMSIIIP